MRQIVVFFLFMVITFSVTITHAQTTLPQPLSRDDPGQGNFTIHWKNPSYGNLQLQEFYGGFWRTVRLSAGASAHSFKGRSLGSYTFRNFVVTGFHPNQTVRFSRTRTHTARLSAPPQPPGVLNVPSRSTRATIPLSWSYVSSASRYEIVERRASDSQQEVEVYNGSTHNTFLNNRTDDTYFYKIRSCNDYECGHWSAEQSMVVLLLPGTPGQ